MLSSSRFAVHCLMGASFSIGTHVACPTGALALAFAARSFASSTGSSAVVDVASDSQFDTLLSGVASSTPAQLAVVDFTAKWCGPCKAIAPIYEELSKANPNVKFLKVDIDNSDLQKTVNSHGITGVPTFVFYLGERRVDAFSGARADHLKDLIKKHAPK